MPGRLRLRDIEDGYHVADAERSVAQEVQNAYAGCVRERPEHRRDIQAIREDRFRGSGHIHRPMYTASRIHASMDRGGAFFIEMLALTGCSPIDLKGCGAESEHLFERQNHVRLREVAAVSQRAIVGIFLDKIWARSAEICVRKPFRRKPKSATARRNFPWALVGDRRVRRTRDKGIGPIAKYR